MLYKVYPPTIRVEYKDGAVAEHRLVWQNVRSGFLVSSLPRELSGVRKLLETGEADKVSRCPLSRQLRGLRTGVPSNLASGFPEFGLTVPRAHSANRFDRVEADDTVGGDGTTDRNQAKRLLGPRDACRRLTRQDPTLTVSCLSIPSANEILARVADLASSDLLDFVQATSRDCSLSTISVNR